MAAAINPKGPKSDKIWRDAIMRAVRRLETDAPPKKLKPEQKLERLADALVTEGIKGEVPALKEIGDRLDGRPVQQVVGAEGGPLEVSLKPDIDLARTIAFLLQRDAKAKP